MSDINSVAPKKATGEAQEYIELLWGAFVENYEAFKAKKMSLDDEVVYNLLSSPGPAQYNEFSRFFDFFNGGKDYIWSLKEQMYMHDFADIENGTCEPDILEFLQKLYDTNDYFPKVITLISGLFWGQHPGTRKKIMSHFKKFYDKGDKVRLLTRAKKEVTEEHASIFTDDSQFYMPIRKPFHFVMAGDDYLYFEFPHTESTVFRLNMLLDLNKLDYKQGKSKPDMLRFLYEQFDAKYDEVSVK
jgi:hypothetical protein